MKLVRFRHKENIKWGVLDNDTVRILNGNPFRKIQPTLKKIPLARCRLLPPAVPGKIILTGLNYKDHAREMRMKVLKEPIIFLKPNTSVIGHNDAIIYPPIVKQLDYEAELAVVMRKKAKNIDREEAFKYILGYTCLNDITARDIQHKDKQWTRAKSFDTFCPLGPWIETQLNPSNLKIQLYLNGKLKQSSTTASFIFPVDYLVSFISKIMTLFPGDVISTGTPPGVGKMEKGDVVEIKIAGIGTLKNYVI